MKKTIAKHTLGLIGLGILWGIIDWTIVLLQHFFIEDYRFRWWEWDGLGTGIALLGLMLIVYIVICLIHWSVKTIWFDKDKD